MSDLWVGVLIALLGGLAGVVINTAVVHREQNRAHWREQQRKDAETLGPVLVYLTDSDPAQLAGTSAEARARRLQVLGERRDRLRESVAVLGAGHPDPTAGQLARQLEAALHTALSSAARAGLDEAALSQAQQDHAQARAVTDQLVAASARYGRRTDETALARARRRLTGGS
ncbi:MAG TPA: hypothetical protein PLP61_00990 [Nocardioides sp.]|uniref:hypothetical protein n=1 Tax=Nocardioides sp. TaxID=35761 RepID=UPI002C629C6B|nr:hypothetical protein [Nocardioides sp.]HQR25586.1 hypothetical protein [Nocardioides sp.]